MILEIHYRSATLTGAVSSAAVQFVTIITHAAEHPWKVLARAEHTDVLEITLIDVCGKAKGERENVSYSTCMKKKNNEKKKIKCDRMSAAP